MAVRIRKIAAFVAVAAVAFVAAVVFLRRGDDGEPTNPDDTTDLVSCSSSAAAGKTLDGSKSKTSATSDSADFEIGGTSSPDGPEAPKTKEEQQAEEDEKKVDAFDSLTDKWMKKEDGEVTMKDIDDFAAAFKSIPPRRKNECLHRALNLVSDDHALLLAGILFDKSIDKEYLELVFNDVLNRDEEVKKLILPKIFKDKDHPCWADTAWILEATGELPTPKKEKSK